MSLYQLQMLPGTNPCDAETEERVCQEILDSIKECLWHRQDCAQPEEELRQNSTSTSRPDPQAEYRDRMHSMYDHYKDLKERSCKEALAVA